MINEKRLLDTFLSLVRIDSPSGEESAMAQELAKRLRQLGLNVELDAICNVVAKLLGQGTPLLLAAHMDTVMPGRSIKPVVKDGVVYSDGTTILGADDKAGVAIILELLQVIVENKLPHPSLEVVITVQEETGLVGAKHLDKSRLQAKMGISFDAGGTPGTIVVAAPSHDLIAAVVHGKAAHAGTRPEEGINAILVAAQAVVNMPLGRIDDETTANIGIIKGGIARNIVPDRVELMGEARSRQLSKLEAQVARMVEALQAAAKRYGTTVDIEVTRSYNGYTFNEEVAIVKQLMTACRAMGVEPILAATGGGSDANIYNASGMQVVNLSTGLRKEHSTEEHIAVADMVTCAQIVMQFLNNWPS
nr:M20/M25/M40 family metallo-hydrolase [Chloroflexota bacterium]